MPARTSSLCLSHTCTDNMRSMLVGTREQSASHTTSVTRGALDMGQLEKGKHCAIMNHNNAVMDTN